MSVFTIRVSNRIKHTIWVAVTLPAFYLFCACDADTGSVYKETRTSMYTVVTVTAVTNSPVTAKKAFDESYSELDRLASVFNFYDEKSDLSAINHNAGVVPVKVSGETLKVIEKAVEVSKMTDGAFDVTVGSLVKLWDMNKKIVPDKETIEKTKKNIGYEYIVIDRAASTIYIKKKGVSIDLGGIIKGYAADRIVEILRKHGIKSGIAQVGGEVRTFGRRPHRKPWTVGIQNPRQTSSSDEIIAAVDISDKAMSTSGDYNKYFEKDGRRYHHLIDPKTGYPSLNCGSATVMADDGITSDGFSKLYILGPKKGIEAAKKAGVEIIFIDCNGDIAMTDGFRSRIKFLKK
jgi:FAD:protein FMN transferase